MENIPASLEHYEQALLLMNAERLSLAMDELTIACDLDPSNEIAQEQLDHLIEHLAHAETEIVKAKEHLQQKPDDVKERYYLAHNLFQVGRLPEAKAEWIHIAQANLHGWSKTSRKMVKKRFGEEVSGYEERPDRRGPVPRAGQEHPDQERSAAQKMEDVYKAINKNDLPAFQRLLEEGIEIEHESDNFRTPLTSATSFGNFSMVRLLVDHGADVDHLNQNGRTPLMEAAQYGRLELVEYFLAKGVKTRIINRQNDTALSLARRKLYGHRDMIEQFLINGSDIRRPTNDKSKEALSLLYAKEFQQVIDLLEQQAPDLVAKYDLRDGMDQCFLIRSDDVLDFQLLSSQYADALHPDSLSWKQVPGWGDFRIHVADFEIAFTMEPVGIEFCFTEHEHDYDQTETILNEVARNIGRVTGFHTQVIHMS